MTPTPWPARPLARPGWISRRIGLRSAKSRTGPDGDGLPTPAAVQVGANHVRVGDGFAMSFAVVGYPSEVGPAWLDPLLSHPGRVDVALHIDPIAPVLAALTTSPEQAREQAHRTAAAILASAGTSCRRSQVTVDVTAFRPGGQVVVSIACTVDLAGLDPAGLPATVAVKSSATTPLETYRSFAEIAS